MPSGYTAPIISRPDYTFRQYALACACAFGACVMQREDAHDDPPKHREVDGYHAKALKEAEAKAFELSSMTIKQAKALADAEYRSALQRHDESARKDAATRARYEAMLAKVVKYKPPTPDHDGYASFMADQIRESIKWDCHDSGLPMKLSGADWLKERRERAAHDVEYHSKHHQEEIERVAKANAWIDALYASLKEEPGSNG